MDFGNVRRIIPLCCDHVTSASEDAGRVTCDLQFEFSRRQTSHQFSLIILLSMKLDDDLLTILLSLPLDIILVALAGIVSCISALHCDRITDAHTYLFFLEDEAGNDVIRSCLLLIGLVGTAQLVIAGLRFKGYCRLNFNKYLLTLVVLLLLNFIIGIVLTDFKTKVSSHLDGSMREKLKESILAQRSLGVGYGQSEKWDRLQTQMFCCGVENYQDYISEKIQPKDQVIPMSCCVMKHTKSADGTLVADNPSQCLLDAAHKMHHSVFLHIQGCHGALGRWIKRYISRITALLFTTLCVQAATLLYLSWHGYQRQLPSSRRL